MEPFKHGARLAMSVPNCHHPSVKAEGPWRVWMVRVSPATLYSRCIDLL
jgi:hypothetical protein